ncbi:uncharacterized protein LOC122757341 [Drosophila mojavensis]|uniref:uncharacterized protein LOC122757341 n=1 Tax=Drosophila mojavensis TaxID=7230 RepID=UPI001CD0B3BB|nr:uncharacterized protein LOC122757341 [Drosophila mojavensis]
MDFVDNQVRWSTWACPEAVLRQCHQFRGCCTHAGPQSYVPWQHSGHGNVCCGAGHGVCIHPSSSAAFWRPLGSGGEIRQRFAAESDGQRSITARRGGHRAGRGRGRAQFAANGRSQQQPQRRRSAHARALPDRSNARAAANRVHRASRRRQADTIKRWQLTSNIKRRFWNDWSRELPAQPAAEVKMDEGETEHTGRSSRARGRGQRSSTTVDARRGDGSHSRRRW